MNDTIQILILGLIGTYLILRILNKKQKPHVDISSGILNNDEYKVKGQWDK